MRCYTLYIGGVPEPGIRITDQHPEVPAVVVGPNKGTTIPIDPEWFDKINDLQAKVRSLPNWRRGPLSLPLLRSCDLLGGELIGEERTPYKLVSRSCDDKDGRILVHLKPQGSGSVSYTGRYRVEYVDPNSQFVTTRFPRIDDVVGIEVIAINRGEALLIMHPGSSFRVTHPCWGGGPGVHMYRLTTPQHGRPSIVDITIYRDRVA